MVHATASVVWVRVHAVSLLDGAILSPQSYTVCNVCLADIVLFVVLVLPFLDALFHKSMAAIQFPSYTLCIFQCCSFANTQLLLLPFFNLEWYMYNTELVCYSKVKWLAHAHCDIFQ